MYGVCRKCFGTDGITICGKCGDELCGDCFAKHACALAAIRESRVPLVVKSAEEGTWRQKKLA